MFHQHISNYMKNMFIWVFGYEQFVHGHILNISVSSLNNCVIKTHTNQLLLLLICQHLSIFFLLFCNTYQSFVGSSSHKSAAFFNLMDLELNNKEINKDYFLWNILLPHFMIFHNTRDKFSCLVIWYATRHVSEY